MVGTNYGEHRGDRVPYPPFNFGYAVRILLNYEPAFLKALGQFLPPSQQRTTIPVFIRLLSARIAKVHVGTQNSDNKFQPISRLDMR